MVDPTGMAADTTVNISVSAKMEEKNSILKVTQTTTTTIVDKGDEGMTTTKIVSTTTDRVSSDPTTRTEGSDVVTNTVKSFRPNSGKEKVLDRRSIQEARSKTKVDMGPLKEVTKSLERYRNTNGEQFVTAINRYGTNATAVAGAGAAAPFGAASLATQLVNKIFGKGSQLATGILAILPSVGVSTSNHGVSKYISAFGVGNEKIMLIKQNNVERFRFLKK